MTELAKILVGPLFGFACGIASGVLLEKWRDRHGLRFPYFVGAQPMEAVKVWCEQIVFH